MNRIGSIDELKDLANFQAFKQAPLAPSLHASYERELGNRYNVSFSFDDQILENCQISIEYVDHKTHIEVTSSFSRDRKPVFERKCKIENDGSISYSHFWVSHLEFKSLDSEGYIRLVEHKIGDSTISLIEVWGYPQDDFPALVFLNVKGIAFLPLRNSEDIYGAINSINEYSEEEDDENWDEDDWVDDE
ncbi:hypothetical protein QEH52_19185 [Coraliomargarita sp. SDUM461003]|uniref:Ribosome maturation factor RimM n=1 Tax=Thalassobacterium maritimum TaxID=3041265 RepID=A0ABU1AZS8_9BACT|nr:hypothetical protein [Coraliomargarita sp. SDUM461003]MDQ8209651.1 hypothetical protein [Coraliomargarita sp. SDUM461003]